MMNVKPLDRQSLVDLAVQTGGGVEAAFEMSAQNDIALSAPLTPQTELRTAAVVNKAVQSRYQAQHIRPATELSAHDTATAPYGGVGFMGIEIDFIVS